MTSTEEHAAAVDIEKGTKPEIELVVPPSIRDLLSAPSSDHLESPHSREQSPVAPSGGHRQRRRSSIVNTSRRYSDGNLATYEAFYLSSAIFEQWDTEHRGYVTPDQVKFDNVNPKFCSAVARMVGFGSDGKIAIEHVAECISVLKYGNMQSKVKLLVQFMDRDGNGVVSYDEIKEYLRVADDKMMDRLGLSIQSKAQESQERRSSILPGAVRKGVLSYEDILSLFQMSDRGDEAITIFCEQILRVLSMGLSHRHGGPYTPEQISRRNSIVLMGNEIQFPCWQYLCCCSGWAGDVYFKLRQYLQHVSHVQIFKIALIALQIFLWLFYFFYHKTRGYPLAFCFAKGFGLNLRILSLLVYFTMARTAMGHLYALKLVRPFIPLGINIEVHSFIGFCIVMHAFGHTFGHIAYKEMHTEKGFGTAFTQNSLLRGGNWEEKLKGDGKTGFILLAFLIVMASTALIRAFSAVHYKWFYFCHFLYLLYLPMLFLHMPQLWPYFIAITALMVVERAYDLFQNTLYTTLAASRPCANGITFLSVPRYGMQTYPGSYYRIRIPALSPEWHPFSLAGSTSSHHLYFFIASAGDWTRALHQLVSDPEKRPMTLVQVQGPFLAPASQALIRKPKARILCVASGIGITPFFSLMATKVTDEVNYDNERQMYRALFAETKDGGVYTAAKHKNERNSLMEVLQKQWKLANDASASASGNATITAPKENSSSNLLGSIISAARRNTNSNLDAIARAALGGGASNSSANNDSSNNVDPASNNGSRSGSAPVSRSGSHSNLILLRQANSNSNSRAGSNTNILATPAAQEAVAQAVVQEPSTTTAQDGHKYSELPRTASEEKATSPRVLDDDIDLHELIRLSQESENEEDESLLKVVWSIRELSELSFYVDYVHHLVKAQEQLMHDDDEEMGGGGGEQQVLGEAKDQSMYHQRRKRKPRVVVEVEVFLTGLGSKSDPVYMLSQTLFLLSIAHTSSSHMKIHFGRPDLEKLVRDFRPEEVYYCGGNALKSKLSDVCRDSHIEFHPEDFDAGGGDFVRSVYKAGATVQNQWWKLFPGCKPAPAPATDKSGSSRRKSSSGKEEKK
jgi:hypothetical protein